MRKDWDTYFMDMAKLAATRSTCDRAHVGCIIVKDKHVISTGYNGALSGQPSCDEVGHLIRDAHCIRSVHAEGNALCQSAKYGNSIDGGVAYCTHFPCVNCMKLLIAAGIRKIYYSEAYRPELVPDEIKAAVELIKL